MDIESIKNSLGPDIQAVQSIADLEAVRLKYLGRKGLLSQLTAVIPTLEPAQRGQFGKQVNDLKNTITAQLEEKQRSVGMRPSPASAETIDIGMPGVAQEAGRLHILTQVVDDICTIFKQMGFVVVDGPEIETEYNNFTGLNIPLDHPSREAFDTFYCAQPPGYTERFLLRSQTSTVQIRAMKKFKPPLAVVAPGRVYRPDAVDASHSFMFHQIEGLIVDEGITFSDLKGVLEFFAKEVFGQDIRMRFRPHHFPFTEPSAEVDISCFLCKGKGCSACGRKGWLEILGSGMVHPNVLKNVGYDPKKYSGFAFGMGVERIAMLKYGIHDIRFLFENDLRFLKQF
jgi:phenylalanyl-tRNA synthetase alpha chain